MDLGKIKKNMVKGKPARLFPVLPESKKEEKATSILLAIFTAVPDFARTVLSEAGAPIGKRSSITCFTEVSFKGSKPSSRPDGLIVVSNSGKEWAALVETKVGRADLTNGQVEDYLDIAKEQGFDAVITIGNQFAALPSHHPVKVNKNKTRQVQLFHFSWLSIISRALLLVDSKAVVDAEQAYMLKELVRYLEHPSSGVTSSIRMSNSWRDVVQNVHQNIPLKKYDEHVAKAVSDWFQLLRYLSIRLSLALGQPCSVSMPRKHISDPSIRLADTIAEICDTNELKASLEIPNAAGKLELSVSLLRKTIDLGINLDTPKNVKQPRAAISFVLNQMRDFNGDDLTARVNWPRRVPSTALPIHQAREETDRKQLIPENLKELPSSMDLLRIVDLGVGKLKSGSGLPEIAEAEMLRFYQDAVQGLKKWVPDAPRIRAKKEADEPKAEAPTEAVSSILDWGPIAMQPSPFTSQD
ncbi:MAG: hypothetical protein V7742_11380 [Halioglobus sp.]